MATDEQNVYITGHGLREWSTEATQKQIDGSLKQIMADNNALLRYTAAMASGDKNANKILGQAVNAIRENTKNDVKGDKKEQIQGNRIVNSQQKIASSSLASLSAVTGLGSTMLDVERREKKRDDTYNALLTQNFSEEAANKGADRAMQMDLYKSLGLKFAAFSVATMGLADMLTGGAEQGFGERFAMVAEMRQAGLLHSLEDAENGFISMSKTISNTNFTFGEATQFTKQFAKAVGVNGVKSALSFANTVAKDGTDGMNYMRKYALEFGQVSNIAGEYLDSLRIGGQLRGMDDRSMRSGMDDFMSNVEMTSNVLKISMEDAADLMKKAFGPTDVALLATLPEEQRKAIDAGFKSVNAQGNPMAETLAKRLAAGSRGAFLQTAEYQEMAGTAPGREVLNFVEQMAGQLENGDTESFQTALAQGFPELADKLVQMSSQGGVRVQLLSDPQLASMVGQIIEAAQTYGDAAGGTQKGTQEVAEQAAVEQQIQIREALKMSEAAVNIHMAKFVDNVNLVTVQNEQLAIAMGKAIAAHEGAIELATGVSTWWQNVQKSVITTGVDLVGSAGNSESAGTKEFANTLALMQKSDINGLNPVNTNQMIDDRLKTLVDDFAAMQGMEKDKKESESARLFTEIIKLNTFYEGLIKTNVVAEGGDFQMVQDNQAAIHKYANELNEFVQSLKQQ